MIGVISNDPILLHPPARDRLVASEKGVPRYLHVLHINVLRITASFSLPIEPAYPSTAHSRGPRPQAWDLSRRLGVQSRARIWPRRNSPFDTSQHKLARSTARPSRQDRGTIRRREFTRRAAGGCLRPLIAEQPFLSTAPGRSPRSRDGGVVELFFRCFFRGR